TNEVRAVFNLTYGYFNNNQSTGPYLLTGMLFTNPVNEFMTQGRNTDTYSFSDDAAYQRGRHYIQFGFNAKNIRVRSYDVAGTVPTYALGLGQGHQDVALARNNLPGVSSTDLATANALLATLGGYLSSDGQTFNV